MPRPKRQLNPLIRKYIGAGGPAQAEARGLGELRPVEPAARREGAPLLGDGQVYVMKYASQYHTAWCQVVADKWDQAPRGLLVTMLADVGARTRCHECDRPLTAPGASTPPGRHMQPRPSQEAQPREIVIPLKVIAVAHGIVFLAAGPEYRERLKETSVEPATPMSVGGRRDGMVKRLDVGGDEPLVVVQLDPRANFQDGPYQVRLRRPLLRSATKPYAVEAVEPAP